MQRFPYNHIVVIGTTGSGKSTLAKRISDRFGHSFIELDALHWEPDWQDAPLEIFTQRVQQAINQPKWVVAGNYRGVRNIIWGQADALLWLDFSFGRTLYQLTNRTIRRWWNHELLWGTNYETMSKHIKIWSSDSLFNWLLKTYGRRKREIPLLLQLPEYRHLKMLRFRHPADIDQWLDNMM